MRTARAGSSGTPTAPPDSDGGEEEPERLISEADIIKLDGTSCTLSLATPASVIDVSDPGHLVLLGGHKTSAIPFEMYVEGDRAYVMYNGWGRYTKSTTTATGAGRALRASRHSTSRIRLQVAVIGKHDMPGDLSDSRKVGDVLYLVTFENGYCYQCDDSMNTRVTSFNVANPDAFQLVDETRLVDANGYWGQRSITVTTDRIYVSGMDWGGSRRASSTWSTFRTRAATW